MLQSRRFTQSTRISTRHWTCREESGIDERVRKSGTLSITYLFTRGIHQYLSNNVSAPQFDPSNYTITGPSPSVYDYQFQSGGLYNQQQIIVSANLRFR